MSALIVFIQKAIAQGIGMLFGATGEIITEKSGNLNLGVPGLMYMGGIAGLMGAFIYESGAENPSGIVGVLISMLCALLASGFGALIYSVLTITLRANQNVTGLSLIHISCINRYGKIIIPGGMDCIQAGDTVVIVTTHTGFQNIEDILR